jgi:hypothetical protein
MADGFAVDPDALQTAHPDAARRGIVDVGYGPLAPGRL